MVEIGGFMIEKNPNPNHNHNFSRRSTHNPNYSTILSEKSTPNINHNSTQHLYHPQPQQHHNFVAQNIPNPNHSPIFLRKDNSNSYINHIFFYFATPTTTWTPIFENLQPQTKPQANFWQKITQNWGYPQLGQIFCSSLIRIGRNESNFDQKIILKFGSN